MSQGIPQFESMDDFSPNADITMILEALRETGLSWIADEIETAIRTGKQVSKETQRYQQLGFGATRAKSASRKEEIVTVPFDGDEQMSITTQTLRNYLVTLHKVWDSARRNLSEFVREPELTVVITFPDTEEPLTPFYRDYEEDSRKLDAMLRHLMSKGESHDL